MAAANVVPAMLAPKGEPIADDDIAKPPEALSKLNLNRKTKLFQKVDLNGTQNWTVEEQAEVLRSHQRIWVSFCFGQLGFGVYICS